MEQLSGSALHLVAALACHKDRLQELPGHAWLHQSATLQHRASYTIYSFGRASVVDHKEFQSVHISHRRSVERPSAARQVGIPSRELPSTMPRHNASGKYVLVE